MRRLDLYVLRDFLLYTLMGIALFVGIYILVDGFEKIDTMVDNHAPARLVLLYYFWGIPVILVQVLPLAALLGAILSLGQLKRFNEVTAMQGAGVSPIRIAAPMLAAGLLLSGGTYAIGELTVPQSYRNQTRILKTEIKRQQATDRSTRLNVRYLGENGQVYSMELYDGATGTLRNVTVQQLRGEAIVRRIDAETASLQDGMWRFERGYIRAFEDSSETSIRFTAFGTSSLKETPADFARVEQSPFQMNMKDLRRYADRVAGSGGRDRKLRVDYHLRVSFPLATLIMTLLGSSLSLRIVRGGNVAVGIGATIFVGFAYYAFIRAGQALGYNGAVPPMLAAWAGNLLFAAIGSVFFWKVTR